MGGEDPHNPFEDGDSVPVPSRKKVQDKDPFAQSNRKTRRDTDDPFSPTDADVERDVEDEIQEDGPSTRNA